LIVAVAIALASGVVGLSGASAASSVPTISGFKPSNGPVGTSVKISGTNLTGATVVTFAGTAASYTVNSAKQITAIVPTGATTGAVSVTTPFGTATRSTFTVTTVVPKITGFAPASGPVGTSVKISGSGFAGATSVAFNGVAAVFTVVSASRINATVPLDATTGAVTVTTPSGTATRSTFTVTVPTSTTTLYVAGASAACSDSGPGTSSQPFCTIGAAASKVVAGQTVQVAAGSYPENVTISKAGTASAPIVFTAAAGATVTVSGQVHGFTVTNATWITINGFTVTGTTDNGISVSGSSDITISANHVSFAGLPEAGKTNSGILLKSNTTNSLVVGNTADHNSYAGIEVNGGSTGNEVRGNVTFSNAQQYQRAAPGIRVYQAPGNTIDRNVSHDNEDSGIESYNGANNTLIYNNVTYNNGDHGIDDLSCTGQRIIGNTVFHNVTAGINLEGPAGAGSTGGTIANNISVDNGIRSPRTHSNIRVDNQSTSGTTVDSNVVYLSGGVSDVMLIWNSVNYTSLAAFQAATGQEAHGIQADPEWKDPASGDFHLLAGSPAIDSANSGVSGQPSQDIEAQPRIDDPATANTGLGPRSYDDRGAYEFQPSESPPGPSARLSLSPTSGEAPALVTADASASIDATPIASYTFDFGDGTVVGPQAGATATHTYQAVGTYTVTLTVTDTSGLSSQISKTVSVTAPVNLVGNPGFETDLSGWTTGASGTNVTLTQVAGGHSGGFAAALTNVGTVNTGCTLTDSPDWVATTTSTGTYTATIWVRADAPGRSFSLRFTEWRWSDGLKVGEVASSAVALSTAWQQVTVSYTPKSPGLTHLDLNALTTAATSPPGVCFYADDVSILRGPTAPADLPPVAALSVSPASGAAPFPVTADASASSDGDATPIASYSFDFGDGTPVVGPQTGATAAHTYTTSGTYTVTVTVTDTGGLSSQASRTVSVAGPTNLVGNPGFEANLAGWNTSGSGSNVTLTQVAGGHSGGFAAMLTNTGTVNSGCTLNDSPSWVPTTSAGTYTATIWVRADSAGRSVILRIREYNKTTSALVNTATSTVILTTSWQQVTLSYTPASPGSTYLDLNAYTTTANSPPGTCFYVDDVAIYYG